jgi:hypothetical protein
MALGLRVREFEGFNPSLSMVWRMGRMTKVFSVGAGGISSFLCRTLSYFGQLWKINEKVAIEESEGGRQGKSYIC